jgi:transposase
MFPVRSRSVRGFGRKIARSANLGQITVHDYLRRFTAAGLSWPLTEQTSEAELEAALFSADARPPRAPVRYLPDFAYIYKELQEHHVTLQLLWEEHGATHPGRIRNVRLLEGNRRNGCCKHKPRRLIAHQSGSDEGWRQR